MKIIEPIYKNGRHLVVVSILRASRQGSKPSLAEFTCRV